MGNVAKIISKIEHPPPCPECGSVMALRAAKKGPHKGSHFFGCSRFPRCKKIVNIDLRPEDIAQAMANLTQDEVSKQKVVAPKSETPLTENQKKKLEVLKKRLLNISSRNRSLRLNTLYHKWAFDLSDLSQVNVELPNQVLQEFLGGGAEINLIPLSSDDEKANRISKNLEALYRNLSEIENEKGLYDLNIGFPFIRGKTLSGHIIQAPVFLISVRLEKQYPKKGKPRWRLFRDKEEAIAINKILLMGVEKYNNQRVHSDIFEEEIPRDLYGEKNFIEWTHSSLTEYGLDCFVNPKALDKELDPIPEFSMTEPPDFGVEGRFEIFQSAVLGHFPQSNSSLQRDYEHFLNSTQEELDSVLKLIEVGIDKDLATSSRQFVATDTPETPSEESLNLDHRPETENIFLMPSDSSQNKILLHLQDQKKSGLVVWGPPGSGKSQTIVNIIGDCLSRSQTVLVVCDKRTALDVVYQRLEDIGLSEYLALVHHAKNDRKGLYSKLESKIESFDNSERNKKESFSDLSKKVGDQAQRLNSAFTEQWKKHQSGVCLFDVYRTSSRFEVIENLQIPPRLLQLSQMALANELATIKEIYNQYVRLNLVKTKDQRQSFKGFTAANESELKSVLRTLIDDQEFKGAVERLWLSKNSLSAQVTKTTNSETLFYLKNHKELHSFQGFSKWFSGRFWNLKSQISQRLSQDKKLIEKLRSRDLKRLKKYLIHEVVEALDQSVLNNQIDRESLTQIRSELLGSFFQIVAFDNAFHRLSPEWRSLVKELMNHVQAGTLDVAMDWSEVLRARVYEDWASELETSSPVVAEIRSGAMDTLRFDFRNTLAQKFKATAEWLKNRLDSHGIDLNSSGLLKKVKGKVSKKRNVPTLRQLNDEFIQHGYHKGTVPCWLVSPEVVSDVFPIVKGLFDVVIFDEASQLAVEYALPAIYRGKKVVIAGDEKQLPPSNLFEASMESSEMLEEIQDAEALESPSLLNLANQVDHYKNLPLEWHYRSKSEELISFSNQAFYSGMIKTCPNIKVSKTQASPAISWHRVNGYWSDRANEAEATFVVGRIRHYLSLEESPTIGVITFNINQKELILDMIDKLRQEDSEFEELYEENLSRSKDSQLFVKNIENVQGDEREVIIFSVGYAPIHPGGRVIQQFGSLSQEGGENRLNVAVTRAIERIEIVSSIDPNTDLDTSQAKNQGPKLLQKYLQYAKAVSERDFNKVDLILGEVNMATNRRKGSVISFESPFEEQVYEELRKYFELDSQVGQSGFRIDFAVVDPKEPEKYLFGLECDGAQYHSSVSARERDAFRHEFLEKRGWKIYRLWSANWWSNRDQEIAKIRAFATTLMK